MRIPVAPDCWRLWRFPEAPASPRASAFCYGRPEDVLVLLVVIPEGAPPWESMASLKGRKSARYNYLSRE